MGWDELGFDPLDPPSGMPWSADILNVYINAYNERLPFFRVFWGPRPNILGLLESTKTDADDLSPKPIDEPIDYGLSTGMPYMPLIDQIEVDGEETLNQFLYSVTSFPSTFTSLLTSILTFANWMKRGYDLDYAKLNNITPDDYTYSQADMDNYLGPVPIAYETGAENREVLIYWYKCFALMDMAVAPVYRNTETSINYIEGVQNQFNGINVWYGDGSTYDDGGEYSLDGGSARGGVWRNPDKIDERDSGEGIDGYGIAKADFNSYMYGAILPNLESILWHKDGDAIPPDTILSRDFNRLHLNSYGNRTNLAGDENYFDGANRSSRRDTFGAKRGEIHDMEGNHFHIDLTYIVHNVGRIGDFDSFPDEGYTDGYKGEFKTIIDSDDKYIRMIPNEIPFPTLGAPTGPTYPETVVKQLDRFDFFGSEYAKMEDVIELQYPVPPFDEP